MAQDDPDDGRVMPPLWLLIGATALGPATFNLVVPALPVLVAVFDGDAGGVNLTLSLYLVTFAVGQLFFGPVADRYGRRPTLLAGLAIFATASLLCSLAGSLQMLIVGRVLQAVGGCAAAVVARAMVGDCYDRERAASVLAFVTMVMALAPTMSLACGGYLVEQFGWRAGFIALTVGGGAVLAAAVRRSPETLRRRSEPSGFRVVLGGFRTLLGSPPFVGFALCLSFTAGAYYAFIAGTPFIAVNLLKRTPSEYGLSFLTIAVGYISGSFVAARVSVRFGIDRMIIIGTAIAVGACAALVVCLAADAVGMVALFATMMVMVFGNGLAMPNTIAAALGVAPRAAGTASGLVGFGQMAVGGLATAAVARLDDGTALPMIVVMMVSALLAALAYAVAVLSDRPATAARRAAVSAAE
jgi:DHA1 family bicyclomycin/chloramphenicol resistance-like MFS transporter